MGRFRGLAWPIVGLSLLHGCVPARSVAGSNSARPSPQAPALPSRPERQPPSEIILTGEFQPSPEALVTLGSAASRSSAKLLVKAGDHVVKGQELARLAGESAATERPRFSPRAESRRASQLSDALRDSLTGHEREVSEARTNLLRAKQARDGELKRAEQERDRALNEASDQLSQAQSAVAAKRAARDKAKALADRNQHAYEEGWISRNEASASKTAYERAESELKEAEDRVAALGTGLGDGAAKAAAARYDKAKEAAEAKVKAAQAALDRVESAGLGFTGNLAPLPDGLPVVSGRITSRTSLRSNVAGTVVNVAPKAGSGLVQLAKDGARWEFVGKVPERDATRLHQGLEVVFPSQGTGSIIAIEAPDPKTHLVRVRAACRQAKPTQGQIRPTVRLDPEVAPSRASG